jgi:hypothetical protein
MNDFVKMIFDDVFLNRYIIGKTMQQVYIAEGLAAMFFVIATCYNLVTNTIKSFGLRPLDIGAFGRTVVLMFLIGVYVPLVAFPIGIINVITRLTEPSVADEQKLAQGIVASASENGLTGSLDKEYTSDPDVDKTQQESNAEAETSNLWDYLGMALSPGALGMLLLDAIAVGIAGIIRFLMQSILASVAQILFILGPYALAVSILPIWQDKIGVWFNTLITIYFSFVVFNIMDGILLYNMGKDYDRLLAGEFSTHQTLAMNLTILVLYLLPTWLAGKIVGSSDAGRVISMAAQTAAVVASSGLAKIPGFDKIASGSASNAAAASKDAMDVK